MEPHEEAFIDSFLVRPYRERCIAKKGLPRDDLWHVLADKLDDRYTYWLPSNIHRPKRVMKVLRRLSKVDSGYCISADEEYEGRVVAADDLGDWEATIVSFVPGKFALYQAEYSIPTPMCILVRNRKVQANVAKIIEQVGLYYKEHNTDLS